MNILLEADELNFLDATKDELEIYLNNSIIQDTLLVCTRRELTKTNYLDKFDAYFDCIRRKMLRLSETTEHGKGDGIIPKQQSVISIPGIIDFKIILKALLIGYTHLESRLRQHAILNEIDFDDMSSKKELGISVVLTIIARANLDGRFSK